jgi:hypothetical protein
MSEASAIVDWVTGDVAMAALIGDRLYPLKLPATPVLPAVTYALVSETQDPIQDGPGLAFPRWRFSVWTERYIDLDAIVRELKVLFNARTDGPFGSSTVENAYQNHDLKTNRWQHVVDVLAIQPA